jgi:hypothetical protein
VTLDADQALSRWQRDLRENAFWDLGRVSKRKLNPISVQSGAEPLRPPFFVAILAFFDPEPGGVPFQARAAVGRVHLRGGPETMRSLQTVYESARINIPAADFPHGGTVPAWDDLEEMVREELETLKRSVMSVVKNETRLFASHQRVIGLYNRGLRHGFFGDAGVAPAGRDAIIAGQQPFRWGTKLGQRARAAHEARETGDEGRLFSQFITATHLLAYEFGQLEQALASPVDFVRRAVGPQRLHEYGELVFALPVLLNYRPVLTEALLAESGFRFRDFYASLPRAPSHLDYLEQGLVALFDPRPESWVKVAADMELATQTFADGTSAMTEDHNAPIPAALTIARKPITAHTLIQQQLRRIEIARDWVGVDEVGIDMGDDDEDRATLWDVYCLTPSSTIRGRDERPGDLVAFEVMRALSEHFEEIADPDITRFAFLRRHLPAFAKGFDERFEAAVDPRALVSARTGAEVGTGLRRFAAAQGYVDAILAALVDVDKTIRDLEHAVASPVEFVRGRLASRVESPVAAELRELLGQNLRLAGELFQEHPEYDFFSTTTVQTESCFDLMRAVLFYALQAESPRVQKADDRAAHRAEARRKLDRLLERYDPRMRVSSSAPQSYDVVLTRDEGDKELDERMRLVEQARVFDAEFEALTRILRHLLEPLHVAFRLNRRGPGSRNGPNCGERAA